MKHISFYYLIWKSSSWCVPESLLSYLYLSYNYFVSWSPFWFDLFQINNGLGYSTDFCSWLHDFIFSITHFQPLSVRRNSEWPQIFLSFLTVRTPPALCHWLTSYCAEDVSENTSLTSLLPVPILIKLCSSLFISELSISVFPWAWLTALRFPLY